MFVEEKAKGEVKELDAIGRALLKAADIIERKGHHKGGAIGPGGSLCVSGAISEAVDWNDEDHHYAICRLRTHMWPSVIAWNDAPERTASEVCAKLRAAAFSS